MTARNYIYKVTATSENFGPIMLHRGIVFNDHGTDYVLHMTFDGPEVLPLDTFKSKRTDRKSTRLNSSHIATSRMPSSA